PVLHGALEGIIFLSGLSVVLFLTRTATTGATSTRVRWLLFLTLGYGIIQTVLLQHCQTQHPILTSVTCHPAAASALSGLVYLASACILFVVVTFAVASQPGLYRYLILG